MGMDHRWQDFANVMNFPETNHTTPYHHHHHYSSAAANGYSSAMASTYPSHHVQIPASSDNIGGRNSLLHNTVPTPMNDHHNTPYSSLNNSCGIGATVANSMNLANNPVAETAISGDTTSPAFKIESSHQETVYPYQNGCTAELNHTTEGFLSSILNDDDLQMTMDIALNEGMYPMRMMDNCCPVTQNCVERGTDSDSAVSSMGSERVPSLSSDSEWLETNSDSGHTPADHHISEYGNKYRWYENFMYGARVPATGESSPNSNSSRLLQIPQKKYHLYGRRCIPEQNPNHHLIQSQPYHLPPDAVNGATGTIQKPIFRDKLKSKSGRKSEDEQLTRDERKAREHRIPITVYDIINLPMDEFNERLSKYDLSEKQLALIRDIRRRGKNKVAAQNCRKRKLDQITTLEEEVKMMRDRKNKLLQDREFFTREKQKVEAKYSALFRHIYTRLNGNDQQEFRLYEASMQQKQPTSNVSIANLEMDPSSIYNSRTKNRDRKL